MAFLFGSEANLFAGADKLKSGQTRSGWTVAFKYLGKNLAGVFGSSGRSEDNPIKLVRRYSYDNVQIIICFPAHPLIPDSVNIVNFIIDLLTFCLPYLL